MFFNSIEQHFARVTRAGTIQKGKQMSTGRTSCDFNAFCASLTTSRRLTHVDTENLEQEIIRDLYRFRTTSLADIIVTNRRSVQVALRFCQKEFELACRQLFPSAMTAVANGVGPAPPPHLAKKVEPFLAPLGLCKGRDK